MAKPFAISDGPERKLRAHDFSQGSTISPFTETEPKNTPFIYAVMGGLALMIVLCIVMCIITAKQPPAAAQRVKKFVCTCAERPKVERGQ